MTKKQILKKTETYIRKKFETEGTGHDWWHIKRVLNNARAIGRAEKADMFIVELGALLHDIADFKFHGGDDKIGGQAAAALLQKCKADSETIKKVRHIVDNVSFKGLGVTPTMKSLEGKVVQDADRLDALGAVGIARAFAYGGHKGRPIYDPTQKPQKAQTFAQYKKWESSSFHHFYEKLLHLKKLMNTKTGKKMAEKRHTFIIAFMKQFLAEWDGKL